MQNDKFVRRLILASALLNCFLLVTSAHANDGEQAGLVLREKITTLDNHEALMADIVIPANAAMPSHQHPGDEFLFMVEGEVQLLEEGGGKRVLIAGQGYQIPAGTIHTPIAGADGARAIVFRVHPEGEAVTQLVESPE